MQNIIWTDRLRNEEVLQTVKKESSILHAIKRRKMNCNDHILCMNCFSKHVTEGMIEVARRGGRRSEQLLEDFKERRCYRKLKEEALDRTRWRTRFGRSYGLVVRQTTR